MRDIQNGPPVAVKEGSNADEELIDPRVLDEEKQQHKGGKSGEKNEAWSGSGISQTETISKGNAFYVEFAPGDHRNPLEFPRWKKWSITLHACSSTVISAAAGSAYSLGAASMIRDLHCTPLQVTGGLSAYTLGFGLVPLVSASLSEEFGRMPVYTVSAIGFMLMFLMAALAKNIWVVIVARFLQGAFGSTGATMVGGTIADIWAPHERGLPMSLFALSAIGSTGLGPVMAGWVEMNPHLEWRWIQWIMMIQSGLYLITMPFLFSETRATILITRIAKAMRKETGDQRYRARVEDERESFKKLMYISCTRPLYLLLTEPLVLSFSVWVALAWGIVYVLVESIAGIFENLHGFNIGQVGTVFVAMTIGSILGFCTNLYQERLYRKYISQRGPEARLYVACAAGILFPISMFIFAWCAYSTVSWVAQAIAIALFFWASFAIYVAVFTYLADCYGPFASSALAGQSLCRNLFATALPLVTPSMFNRLGYHWANTIFALLATIMIPIPFTLFFYGPQIRQRSKFSSLVIHKVQ